MSDVDILTLLNVETDDNSFIYILLSNHPSCTVYISLSPSVVSPLSWAASLPVSLTNVICSNQPIKRAGLLYPDMQAVFDKVMKYSVFILYKGPTNTLL